MCVVSRRFASSASSISPPWDGYAMFYLLQVITVVCSAVCIRGKYDPCALVNAGLQPILQPCETSVEACASSQNFTQLSKIFCLPQAQNQFNNFEQCMGKTFSNQVFGTICSGKGCTENIETCIQRRQTCYQIHKRNNGSDVLKDCKCASPSNGICPSRNCRRALNRLVADVGCCANGLMYTLPLDKCMLSSDSSNLLKKDGLVRLFVACQVPFPPSCSHPFVDMTDEVIAFQFNTYAKEIFSVFPSTMQCTETEKLELLKGLPDPQTCGSAFEKLNHHPIPQELRTICTESCAGSIAKWIANPVGCNDRNSSAYLQSWCQPADGGRISYCKSAIKQIDPVKLKNTDVESCALFALTGLCLNKCANGLRRLASEIGCCYHLFYKNSTILNGLQQSAEGVSENGELFITLLSNPAIWAACSVPIPVACTSTAFKMEAAIGYKEQVTTHSTIVAAPIPSRNIANHSVTIIILVSSSLIVFRFWR